jgi:hypothetical protein
VSAAGSGVFIVQIPGDDCPLTGAIRLSIQAAAANNPAAVTARCDAKRFSLLTTILSRRLSANTLKAILLLKLSPKTTEPASSCHARRHDQNDGVIFPGNKSEL